MAAGGGVGEAIVQQDAEAIGVALGRLPSGCSILTVTSEEVSTGVLVSWVQQAAFEPPSVSVCIKKGRPVGDLIRSSGRFLLNIIGEDAAPMFKHFGRGFSLAEDAFEGLNTQPTDYGPLLMDCVAHLGCQLVSELPVGDHDIYVAHTVAGTVRENAKPYVHLRKSGLSY